MGGGILSPQQAMALANHPDKEALYAIAHEITRSKMGNSFDTCSIINAKSGNCSEDCKWCAQSGHHATEVTCYPLLPVEECVRQAVYNRRQGIGRFSFVTSGKKLSRGEVGALAATVRAVRRECDIKCCASMGLLGKEELQLLFDSGVENYHCNIETAPSHFPTLCSTHTIADKMRTIEAAREVGFRICSGGIIGMGETMEQRIEMALFLRKASVRSIPLNLLQPIPGTPLADIPPLSEEEILTTIALFRFINPEAYLRFSGGRALMAPEVQQKALYIGVNAAIIGDLLTTLGSRVEEDKQLFAAMDYTFTANTDWEG